MAQGRCHLFNWGFSLNGFIRNPLSTCTSTQDWYTGTYSNCPVKSTQDVTVRKHDTVSYNKEEGTYILNVPHYYIKHRNSHFHLNVSFTFMISFTSIKLEQFTLEQSKYNLTSIYTI